MKHLYFFVFLVILVTSMTYSQTSQQSSNNLDEDVKKLEIKIEELRMRQDYLLSQNQGQAGMLDTAFDGVSAELSASSNFIGVFGIIIAIFSVGLSIYVSRIEKNVRNMRVDNELLLQKNIQIKEDLEKLSEKITNDSKGLYKIIRNEESNHLIERLISVPEDSINLFYSLASRDLEKEQYYKLKEAFLQLNADDNGYNEYVTLFFQHFSDLFIMDDDIKSIFFSELDSNFENAFKNDAINSTCDFFNAILQMSLSKSSNEINKYIRSLCNSKFAQIDEIYFKINESISNREQKFELYDVIEKVPETLIFRQKFGAMLVDYNYENLSSREQLIIDDIKTLI